MGIFTDNMQALNRGFVSERAEKKAIQREKNIYKNFLYIKFYDLFYKNQKSPPTNTFAHFQQPDVIQDIICNKKFDSLDGFLKIEIYNNILNKTYKTFKNNYNMNIDSSKTEEKEEKERKRQKLLLEQAIKRRDKAKARYKKALARHQVQKMKLLKITKKGFGQIALGLFVGGRVASKTYKKIKY